MAEEQAVQETTEVLDEGLATEQPDTGPSGEAGKEAPVTQQAQSAPQQEANPAWFKPDLFQLKYRGQQVAPKDYNHAKQLMQQGWSYSQAMAEVNKQKAEIESQRGRYTSYEKLEQAFAQNPQFAQKIWQMYQEAQGQGGQQQAQQGSAPTPQDPQYQRLFQTVSGLQERLTQFDQMQADSEVDHEIQDLKSKLPSVQWDAVTETGHSMLHDVLSHAHQNRFPSLLAAARDYLWDTTVANAQMQGAQQVSQQRQKQARQGIVQAGAPKPTGTSEGGKDIRDASYDDLTAMALKDLGLRK